MAERTADGHLLERAGAGDQRSFLELYERHRLPVFRFAYRLLGSVELAEDVTHDCFLSLLRNPTGFNPGLASLRTYLFAAARNLAFKYLRDSGRETALDEIDEEPSVPERQQPLRRVLNEELALKVREAVMGLPPLQREAVVLFHYEDLSLNEIAAITGTDTGAVKARLYRARQRLKSVLRPYLMSDRELNSSQEIVTLKEA